MSYKLWVMRYGIPFTTYYLPKLPTAQ